MDFKAALVNNIKPFVPSNPPLFSNRAPISGTGDEEPKAPGETPSRRRRRRRNNAARRQELACMLANDQHMAHRPLPLSTSQCSLPTPPSSSPHTPLRMEFVIPQLPQEQGASPGTLPDSQLNAPPVLRVFETSPVIASAPACDQQDKIPVETLQAIATRARERLAIRIQACWDEQQKVVAAATRIQEAYATHIEAQLEKVVAGLKEHLGAEMDKRMEEYEQRRHHDIQSAVNQSAEKAQEDSSQQARVNESVSTVVSQLHGHCKQIRAVFSGLQLNQRETAEAVKEMRFALENVGLLAPQFGRSGFLPVAPVFGEMPRANTNTPRFFADPVGNNPQVFANANSKVTITAPGTNHQFLPYANAGVIRKPVLGEANKVITAAQSINAKVDKENDNFRSQTQVLGDRADSSRL